uniref:Fatty acyl-CoA reductase n=2 Tax=Clastoptera arizonana TaxID=38151 RepID=A0A1B6DYX1_9HEMI
MEFYPKDDLDISIEEDEVESQIQNVYSGSKVLITGATGFIGKILLEKLIRSCNVAQVYLLVRKKKDKSAKDRLDELLRDIVFEPMLRQNKNSSDLITLINGDFNLPDLGISQNDLQELLQNVNFVFHSAATVNMSEHLKTSYFINVNGTRFLLEQAKLMKRLKAFVYISTAYTQVMLDEIQEKFYPTEYSAEDLEKMIKDFNDDELTAITPFLVGQWENTYSFTKAITEHMLTRYHRLVPVAVARPSIIISSVKEPLVGWVDNINGATGVCAGATVGLLRVWRADPNAVADLIPIDVTVNTIISIGWYISQQKPSSEDKIIFNLVASEKNPITWQGYMDSCHTQGINEMIASSLAVGCYNFTLIKNETIYWLYFLIFQFIPGLILDFIMNIAGMTPKFLFAYRKVYKINANFACYIIKQFKYTDKNVDELWSLMNSKDKRLFNFDQTSYPNGQFYRTYMRGLRVYLLKDSMETLKKAATKYKLLLFLHRLIKTIVVLTLGYMIIPRFSI